MKKIIICFFMLIMFIPNIVFADSAGPSILGYDAIIINKDGVKIDGTNKIIPYNTVVHVVDEKDGSWFSDDDKNYYAEITWRDNEGNLERVFIYLKDIKPFEEEQKITSTESIGKIVVMNENGAKLWKGTSSKHESYDKIIPNGTKVNITYANDYYKGLISWYYVNDGEYKGWVSSSDVDFIYQDALLFSKMNLYDENDNIIMTLQKGTVLNEIYMSNSKGKMVVEYQDKKGYAKASKSTEVFDKPGISGIDLGLKTDETILITKNIELDMLNNKKVTIPSNARIKVLYGMIDGEMGVHPVCLKKDECYYYVEYLNQKGFIKVPDELLYYNDDIGIYIPYVGIELYEDYDESDYNFAEDADHTLYSKELYDYLIKNPSKRITNDIKKQYATNIKIKDKAINLKAIYQTIEEKNIFYDATFELIKYNNDNYIVIDRDYNVLLNIEERLKKEDIKEDEPQEENKIKEENNNIIDDTEKHNSKEEIDTVKENNNKKSSSSNTIIFAVIGAGVLAFVSFVTIIVVNKNKKQKEDEKKKNDVKNTKVIDNKNIEKINEKQNVIEKKEVTIEKEEGKE